MSSGVVALAALSIGIIASCIRDMGLFIVGLLLALKWLDKYVLTLYSFPARLWKYLSGWSVSTLAWTCLAIGTLMSFLGAILIYHKESAIELGFVYEILISLCWLAYIRRSGKAPRGEAQVGFRTLSTRPPQKAWKARVLLLLCTIIPPLLVMISPIFFSLNNFELQFEQRFFLEVDYTATNLFLIWFGLLFYTSSGYFAACTLLSPTNSRGL